MRSTATKTVSAPVEKVWEVLSNHEGMVSWGPGMRVTLLTEGTAQRNGVGAVRRIKAPVAPAIVEEITAFEPNVRLGYKALSGIPMKNYSGEVVLERAGNGTLIHYTVIADQRVPVIEPALVRMTAAGLLAALVRAVGKA